MVKTLRQELFHRLSGFVHEGKLNDTPGLKHLLRRKNHLMLCGRLDEAPSCAHRIGLTIERLTKSHLCGVVPLNGLGDICGLSWFRPACFRYKCGWIQHSLNADFGLKTNRPTQEGPNEPKHYASIDSTPTQPHFEVQQSSFNNAEFKTLDENLRLLAILSTISDTCGKCIIVTK